MENLNSEIVNNYALTKQEFILNYDLEKEEDLQIDYRNSNFKYINFYFNFEDEKYKNTNSNFSFKITIKQDYKLGKGGLFWDGVRLKIII